MSITSTFSTGTGVLGAYYPSQRQVRPLQTQRHSTEYDKISPQSWPSAAVCRALAYSSLHSTTLCPCHLPETGCRYTLLTGHNVPLLPV